MNQVRTAIFIEDSKTSYLHLQSMVAALDYDLYQQINFKEVLEFIKNNKEPSIAIVSLDLISNEVEKIINLLTKSNIPIILLSGLEDKELKQKFIKKDVLDYIDKESSDYFKNIVILLKRLDTNINNTILVIDDSSVYRQLISQLLLRHKFNVLEAEDGKDALAILKKNPNIELIVTDYEMPNVDGLELIKNVRKEYSVEKLPIIVISALDKSSVIVDCIKSGANDYLRKPFAHQEFYSRVYLTLSYKENLTLVEEQKTIYETLFHKSSNAILLMDEDKFIDCNEAAVKLLEVPSKDDIIGKFYTQFSPELQPDGTSSIVKGEQLIQNSFERFEWQYLLPNGKYIWVDVLRTPIVVNSKKLTHVVLHDISTMKKLETDLALLNKSLEKRIEEEIQKNTLQTTYILQQSRLAQMGEMISMIAHQWRQPLSSISAISSTLSLDVMMDKYESDFFEERLQSINELSQHLSSTINDFRGFFKEDKTREETTIGTLVEGTLQIIGSTLQKQSVKVESDIKDNDTIFTYVNEVKQVILNILKNAEDALTGNNTSKGTIWIVGYIEDDYACISIEDNAGGITEDNIIHIFDPYFSTKKEKDGTGLGLYMSKTIIEEHCKGKLIIHNNKDGAMFTIKLPLILES
ncbi:MAG: PAS domain S-box-containing protein [Sulfurimonas sp.]|jgi:PAS domain S-box-containing protein|uniref:response regulator n=1 Tax=Sulfurimonas sp. TaxID=2022749 RepID=UPI0039E580C4